MERDTEKARPLPGSGLIRENTSAYGSHLSEAGKGPGMGMIHAPAKEQESLGVRSPGASDEDESGRAARVQAAKAKGQQDGQDGGGNPEVSGQPEQLSLFEPKLLSREAREEHRIIGQLFDTYWLVEYRDSLYIIDQHAAHEKVLYEKTVASLKSREYTSQMINPPIILTLNSSEKLLLEKYMEHFTGIGFEIEPFGGREYAVRAVPANLFSIAKKELLMEMIDGLSDEMDRGNSDLLNEKIASMSCKAAVKGNHRLSEAEARALIDELLELENPYACPHGRPTIISMSRYELEKKFKRIV
ncbi:dNA mismatch repair protein MutL [Clostridium sp. CAG:149]|nr:dNA mismatch repair protein MutL [Clostridium sp. CAG:149]